MCLVKNKLLVYDCLIDELVKWDSEEMSCSKERSLCSLTNVKLMKCLYAACVMSVGDKKNVDDTLFGLFDNFLAYPKGPVEFDTYNNRAILFRYEMGLDKERVCLQECKKFRLEQRVMFNLPDDQPILPDEQNWLTEIEKNGLVDCKNMLIESINVLKHAPGFPDLRDEQALVEITHNNLWQEAYYSYNKQLDTRNMAKLQEEYNRFRSLI